MNSVFTPLDLHNSSYPTQPTQMGVGGGGRVGPIKRTFDFFPFLSWNSSLFRINAILPSMLCIAPNFVFKI